MKKIKSNLFDKSGSALAMTIFVFAIVTIMSACLVFIVTSSQRMDLKTYRQEQAYAYAQAGLAMAYDYVETKASEPGGTDFVQNYLDRAEFEGTISDIAYTDPTAVDNPASFPTFKVNCETKIDGTDSLLVVTATAEYQGVTANASRYLYYSSAEDDDDAIDSVGDYSIKGSVYALDGSTINGDLRGNNIDIDGSANYSSVYALGKIKNNSTGLNISKDIIAHGNVDFSSGAIIGGKVNTVGAVRGSNLAGNPKSIIAWGESGDFSGNVVDIAIDSVGDPANIDSQNVVLYSGGDAKIGGSGGAGGIELYGTVIVNGTLDIESTGIMKIHGNLLVKGDILDSAHLQVLGTTTSNYSDEATFLAEVNNYSIVSASAIDKTLGYPRKFPVTIFPDVCNSHPQRTAADGWANVYVENSAEYAQRQATYKEIDLSKPEFRNVIYNDGSGGTSDDGTNKKVTYYQDYTSRGLFININESGKYINLQQLLNETNPVYNSIVLYFDASAQDLDVCLDGLWDLGMNNMGSHIKSQVIINDGGGSHTVRLFLEKGAILNMNGATQCVGLYNSPDVSPLYAGIRSGQDISGFTDKDITSIPRLFIFSDGELKPDGTINEVTQPKITIATNNGTHPNGGLLRGYIYAPYAYVNIDSTSGPVPFVGKLECGNVVTGGNATAAIYYNKPEAEEYSAAIAGVYYPVNSASGGGSGSVYKNRPSSRDKF